MKIIHFINSLGQGGAEMTLIRLINNSSKSHLIITILNKNSISSKLKKPIKIISIFPISLKKLKYINKEIKLFSPDIFQGWMYHGDLIASISGFIYRKKVFWNLRHGKMSLINSSKKTIFLRTILSIFSYFIPTKIISCSQEGLIVHKKIGYCSKKIIVISNGIKQKYMKNISNINLKNKKEILIASIGRDNPQKGRKYFLEIIEELSKEYKVKALIVGRGVSSSIEIKNAVKNLKVNLKLYESFENVNKILEKIDVLFLTSTYGEGCPNILIEALQSKILCFSTDVGDAKYILNSKELLIPSNNSKKAKDIVTKMINNPKKCSKILKKNYLRSKKIFSPEIMVKKYERCWDSI